MNTVTMLENLKAGIHSEHT